MSRAGAVHDKGRIGIYGGTFNPIHRGHLKAAQQIASALELDRVLFIPSAYPPHKTHLERDPIAPADARLRWVELAIASEPLFEVDDLELTREGASYSIDTLRTLVPRFAPARLVFIMGHDAFVEMGTWREPDAILALVDIIIVSRPPDAPEHLSQCLPEFARGLVDLSADGCSATVRDSDTRIDLLAIDALDVSASQVRSTLARGESVADQVPAAALEAIVSSGHYCNRTTHQHERGSPVEAVSETQRNKLVTIVETALERNAQNPVALDVRELTSYTDFLVIVSGNSTRQVRAIAEHVVKALKASGDQPLGVEGTDEATWVLVDANDVVVHVFEPDTRELFDLEGLWTDAPRVSIELPEQAVADATTQVPPHTD